MKQLNTRKSANFLLLIFVVLTILLSIGGNLFYRYQKKNITIEKHDELSAVSQLKVEQIIKWRNDHLNNARTIFNNQAVKIHIGEYEHSFNTRDNFQVIKSWINSIQRESEYTIVSMIDPKGKIIYITDPNETINEFGKLEIEQAGLRKKITFSDLTRYHDNKICLDLVVPLFANEEKKDGFLGVVLLRIDPKKFLYPNILKWPVSVGSNEILIVRKERDSVLFLSELQHQKNTALRLRKPMSDKNLLVVQAINGKRGIIEGVDYRGVKVLGDIQLVPESSWYIVTKIDADEIYNPIRSLAIWIFLITFLLILISAMVIYLVWKKQANEEIIINQQYLKELVDEQTVYLKDLNQKLEDDIAERNLIEEKLRESEQRLSFHFENSPLGVVEWDNNFIVTQWSKEAERIFGWSSSETIGKPIGSLNIIYEEDIPIVNQTMIRLTSGKETVVISSNRNYTRLGNIIECTWYNTILNDENGKMSSVMSLVEDISERKKTENQLMKLSLAVEQSPISIVITDLKGIIEYGNPKVCEITGYTPEELIGQTPNLFKSGDTPREVYQNLWKTIKSGKEWQGEFHNKKKNGELYWEAASISPIFNNKNEITHFLGVKEDITQRKIIEEELKKAKTDLEIRVLERTAELAKSEERFRTTLDNLMEGCMFIGHDWTYLYVNDTASIQFQKSKQSLIGHTIMQIYPDLSLMPVLEGFQVSLVQRIQNNFTREVQLSDGSIKWFDFHVEPVNEGIFVMSTDITERKQVTEKLRTSEEGFRLLAESVPHFVWVTDPDGMNIYCNKKWVEYTGMTLEESSGTGWIKPFHPDDQLFTLNAWKHATETGETYDIQCRLKKHDDEYHWFVVRGAPLKDSSGSIIKWYGTCTEIDLQKKIEDEIKKLNEELEERVNERTLQLQTSNKELEAFSYSVSHDLRAPLRSIDGWSLALLEDCGDQLDKQGLEYLDRVRTETQRMGHLIDDLLKLSRVSRAELKKEDVDLSTLAHDIRKRLLKSSAERNCEFIIHPGMFTFGDPRMLDIALTNLLENAYKFTGRKEIANIEFGQSMINDKQTYWIRDNGVGFDMSYSKNLFGAFQRMHRQSDFPGTGVGLATVQRIIHRHDGQIWAESKINEGTTFYFTLT